MRVWRLASSWFHFPSDLAALPAQIFPCQTFHPDAFRAQAGAHQMFEPGGLAHDGHALQRCASHPSAESRSGPWTASIASSMPQ